MIAPTSTFYNPEDTSLQQDLDHVQYQQWIEAYGLQQQQQQQQNQHHYSQQIVYDPNYHGGTSLHTSISQINPSYTFAQPQYQSSSSLSQYDGSTSGTVTQSNVGQIRNPLSSYQGQSDGMYAQVYSELIPIQQSAVSTPEPPEGANYSYSTPPNQVPQQTLSQQSRQQQVRRKPPLQPPKAQQPENHALRFVPHPSSSERRQHTSSNPSSSHSSPLIPLTTVWNTEPGYSNPKPNEKAKNRAQSSLRVSSTNTGSSKSLTSQNAPPAKTNSLNPIQFNPTTSSRVSESNPLTSPAGTSFVPEKTGHKRKRAKKNEPAQWSSTGGDSDSDSEDDEGGGISVGMGGLGVVGKGGTKGSRL